MVFCRDDTGCSSLLYPARGQYKMINVFVLMLIGFCSFVFIFVVTVIAIVFVTGVDLDPNRKMSYTFR